MHLNHPGHVSPPELQRRVQETGVLHPSSLNNMMPTTIDTTGLWSSLQHKKGSGWDPRQSPNSCPVQSRAILQKQPFCSEIHALLPVRVRLPAVPGNLEGGTFIGKWRKTLDSLDPPHPLLTSCICALPAGGHLSWVAALNPEVIAVCPSGLHTAPFVWLRQ